MKTEDKYQFTEEEIKVIAWEFWCESFNNVNPDPFDRLHSYEHYTPSFEEYWNDYKQTLFYSFI